MMVMCSTGLDREDILIEPLSFRSRGLITIENTVDMQTKGRSHAAFRAHPSDKRVMASR